MANLPLTLRRPTQCPSCGVIGRVQPAPSIDGDVVHIDWCCESCEWEWPATVDDQMPERRTGDLDRRRATRSDRRQRSDN